jgi:cytochrome c-type biogenesis protein CcmH
MVERINGALMVVGPRRGDSFFESTRGSNSSIRGHLKAFIAHNARQCLSFILLSFVCMSALFAQTPTPAMPPAPPELEARLKKLETELRCLVCQNQTLAESPAGLAGDLRREIRLLADSGKSNEEIKTFLKVRYGDFVLYKPVLESKTYVLWFAPFVMLIGGAVLVFLVARKRRTVTPAPTNDASILRAQSLLKSDRDDDKP